MLEAYGATEVTVVRNEKGQIVSAVASRENGVSDILYHSSPRDSIGQRVSVTTSTRSA